MLAALHSQVPCEVTQLQETAVLVRSDSILSEMWSAGRVGQGETTATVNLNWPPGESLVAYLTASVKGNKTFFIRLNVLNAIIKHTVPFCF